jgi:hypothetical protein
MKKEMVEIAVGGTSKSSAASTARGSGVVVTVYCRVYRTYYKKALVNY